MNAIELKEKLGTNCCHIHKQPAALSISECGNLTINTCCLLFKAQLHLLVDKNDEKLLEDCLV